VYLLEVNTKTIFARLKDIFPECEVLIEHQPQLYPLRCLVNHCPKNANCMEKLVRRVKHVFEVFSEAQLLILYFKWPDRPASIRCGVFWRDLREPCYRTINRSSWEIFKEKGTIYSWEMPQWLLLGAQPPQDDNKLVQLRTTSP
jgi:hypothetical protein